MCDFDLSQALESSNKLDETGFEPSCFNMTDVQDEIFRLDEGLDLVVSHNPVTLQCVANLVLAVTRMKKSLTRGGKQLSGDELCNVIMDSLVEEMIVEKTDNSFMQMKKVYIRSGSVKQCTLCDERNKDIVKSQISCNSEKLKLQAITLQGGNSERKVNFKLSRYITPIISTDDPQAVLLSLPGNWHIICSMKGDKAELDMEECSDAELNSIDDKDNDMDRFLFYKRTTPGTPVTTFESVKCRGWYISTYEDESRPVEMCKVDACQRYTNFSLN